MEGRFLAFGRKGCGKLKAAHLNGKAKALIDVIRTNPFVNPPPYEKLLGNFEGAYSRRINVKHRLVYMVQRGEVLDKNGSYEGTIKIVSL